MQGKRVGPDMGPELLHGNFYRVHMHTRHFANCNHSPPRPAHTRQRRVRGGAPWEWEGHRILVLMKIEPPILSGAIFCRHRRVPRDVGPPVYIRFR